MSEDRIPEGWEDAQHEKDKMLAQAHEQKRMMNDLKELRSYQAYKEYLQNQYDQLVRLVLSVPMGQDDLIKNAYSAGQAAGIKIALDTPEMLINFAQTSIDLARAEEEDYNGEEYRQAGTEGGRAGDEDSGIPHF